MVHSSRRGLERTRYVSFLYSPWLSPCLAKIKPSELTRARESCQIPGFADIPQVMNVSLLRDAEWPNLGSVHSSKGIGVRTALVGVSLSG